MIEDRAAEKIVETLTACLADLDQIEAHIAAAHVDSAIQALKRQFESVRELSDTE